MDWNLCHGAARVNYYDCLEPEFNTKIRMVSKQLLPNGDTFVNQYNNAKHNITFIKEWKPYIMHFNWLHGRKSKLSWIKKAQMWYVEDGGKCKAT